jgi:hypothetical protein
MKRSTRFVKRIDDWDWGLWVSIPGYSNEVKDIKMNLNVTPELQQLPQMVKGI